MDRLMRRGVLSVMALGALAGCALHGAPERAAPDYVVLSQHRGTDGAFWYRAETPGLTADECRAALKRVTTRPTVGFTKWYDITPQYLQQSFGHPPVTSAGSWIGCWPKATRLGEPDA